MAEDELALLLDFARTRHVAPAATIHAGAPPRLLVILTGAVWYPSGVMAGPVIGMDAMFCDPSPVALSADPHAGASLLSIDRQTFFTLAHSRPELIRGFLEIGPGGAAAA